MAPDRRAHGEPGDPLAHLPGPGLQPQKKSLSAQEQRPLARQLWQALVHTLPVEKLVFVDESGCHLAMTPAFAWARKGQRAWATAPKNRGSNTTILGALGWNGWQAALTLEGAADTTVFETFLEAVLVPTLSPGSIVILDNLSIHKSQKARRLVEEAGCSLFFLLRPEGTRLARLQPDQVGLEQAQGLLETAKSTLTTSP